MISRRRFLENTVGAVGVCFVGCGLLGARPARAQGRRVVRIGGKRVKVIDVHAHVAVPEALEITVPAARRRWRWLNSPRASGSTERSSSDAC
jgi:hypothetical protein